MSISADIKIIYYDDKYALDAVSMWRDSKEKALGVKDAHNFDDHFGFLRTKLIKENKVYLAIDERTENVVGIMAIAGSELNQLYIHVDYQGMGIGSRLLQMAKELSPGKLQLFTFEANKNARAFYEKHDLPSSAAAMKTKKICRILDMNGLKIRVFKTSYVHEVLLNCHIIRRLGMRWRN